MKPYHANIDSQTKKNSFYRKVVFTTKNMQLVYMSLKRGEEIGMETHTKTSQFIRVESGKGVAVISGKTYKLKKDFAVIVPPKTRHNIINTGKIPLKLYTIYTPPQHPKNKKERVKL